MHVFKALDTYCQTACPPPKCYKTFIPTVEECGPVSPFLSTAGVPVQVVGVGVGIKYTKSKSGDCRWGTGYNNIGKANRAQRGSPKPAASSSQPRAPKQRKQVCDWAQGQAPSWSQNTGGRNPLQEQESQRPEMSPDTAWPASSLPLFCGPILTWSQGPRAAVGKLI